MTQLANRNLEDAPHVLVVDDDDRIRALVSRFLTENGFIAASASDAGEARAVMERLSFDALVVDVMMPGETGFEFTKTLRQSNDIPVLFLTALGEIDDKMAGFAAGADDYLAKPFEPRELVMRLQALMRRRARPVKVTRLRVGPWLYDAEMNELSAGDKIVRLTAVDGALMQALASRNGDALERDDLAALCGVDPQTRAIDVQVTRLRRKLEDDPKAPRYLQTVRGKGYRLLFDPA